MKIAKRRPRILTQIKEHRTLKAQVSLKTEQKLLKR